MTASSLAPSPHPSTTTSGGTAVGSCGAPIGNCLDRRETLSPSLTQGPPSATLAGRLTSGAGAHDTTGQLRAAAPTHVSGFANNATLRRRWRLRRTTAREWLPWTRSEFESRLIRSRRERH
ncbi:hypothetical protein MTO96_008378 [Rhipicephalus appendiculatus]